MASVLLRNIAKRYDDTEVLRNVNLDIADGNSSCSSGRAAAANPR